MIRPFSNVNGNDQAQVMAFPIATSTALKNGAAVKFSGGKIVAATANAAIAGVTAAPHGGSKAMFDKLGGTDKALVYFDPNQIFVADVADTTLTGGSTTTFTYSGTITADDLNGAVVVYKGERIPILDSAISTGTVTLTVATMAAAPTSADTIKILPIIGGGLINAAGSNMDTISCATSATASQFVCVGYTDDNKALVKPILHSLK